MREIKRCVTCDLLQYSYAFHMGSDICKRCIREIRKFKSGVHSSIRNSIKYGMNSYVWKFLPYSPQDLINHLENQFEPWMNRENTGIYKINMWDDNNQFTWRWQIDHIIPQGAFLFSSLTDESFKQCWALNNLRPLSAKENSIKNRKFI